MVCLFAFVVILDILCMICCLLHKHAIFFELAVYQGVIYQEKQKT